jgi:hypothetical protein
MLHVIAEKYVASSFEIENYDAWMKMYFKHIIKVTQYCPVIRSLTSPPAFKV